MMWKRVKKAKNRVLKYAWKLPIQDDNSFLPCCGAGTRAEIIFIINIFCSQFGGSYDEKMLISTSSSTQGFGAGLFWDGSGSGNLQPGAGSGFW